MKILVCVKQVLDTEAPLSPDHQGKWVVQPDIADFRMNRFDEFALEEALLIKEKFSDQIDVTVDSVSVGPTRVRLTLKKSMALGADNGFHIRVEEEGYQRPFDTAALIASFAGKGGYDLILAGVMAEDDMAGLVGSLTAEMLGYPCATAVMHQEIKGSGNQICVEREIEAGRREYLQLSLPAVVTVQSGINSPRYASLSNVIRAKDQAIATIDAEHLANQPKAEHVVALFSPAMASAGTFLEGTPKEKAQTLLKLLHENSFI